MNMTGKLMMNMTIEIEAIQEADLTRGLTVAIRTHETLRLIEN